MDLRIVSDLLVEYKLSYHKNGDLISIIPKLPQEDFKQENLYDNLYFNGDDSDYDLTVVWITIDAKVLFIPFDEIKKIKDENPELLRRCKTKEEVEQMLSFSKL